MSCSQPTDRRAGDPDHPQAEDAKTEGAVLTFLLHQHPDQLSESELVLAMNRDPEDFAGADAISRAVRELVGGGLLHRLGHFVLPTRAALYFWRLEVE